MSTRPLFVPSLVAGALLLGLVSALGCATSDARVSPTATNSSDRNPDLARELTAQGKSVWAADRAAAEALFRDALSADLFHGPAHNNLGVIYMQRGDLYAAAQEFEWARKLMPGHPDPRLNLGLVLEQAGRVDDAMELYAAALEVYPQHLPSMQALTACELKHARVSDSTLDRLGMIALRADAAAWRRWARLEAAKRSGADESD